MVLLFYIHLAPFRFFEELNLNPDFAAYNYRTYFQDKKTVPTTNLIIKQIITNDSIQSQIIEKLEIVLKSGLSK